MIKPPGNFSGRTASDSNDVERKIRNALQTYLPGKANISLDSKLITDLKLSSDDVTQLALDLEAQLEVCIPRKMWRTVHTVNDLISLLSKIRSTGLTTIDGLNDV